MAASDHLSKQFTLHYGDITNPKLKVETHRVEARKNGRVIGQLVVGQSGSSKIVDEIDVAKKYRRQGVATAMLQHMKDQGVEFKHSRSRTPEGDAFAKSTSEIVPTPKLRQKVPSNIGTAKMRKEI